VVPDLMLASRVRESLAAAGHEVTVTADLPERVQAEAIVCDLDATKVEEMAATGIPTLGFYSHLNVDTRARAKAQGIQTIVPRSRMARELPQLLGELLAER
jgi:hypothetical protein